MAEESSPETENMSVGRHTLLVWFTRSIGSNTRGKNDGTLGMNAVTDEMKSLAKSHARADTTTGRTQRKQSWRSK